MNLKEHITIIHGPNGIGKTVLLKMLNALFSLHYHELRRYPFNELIVDFDDKSNLRVKKNSRKEKKQELVLEYKKYRKKPKIYQLENVGPRERAFPLHMIEEVVPGLERIGREYWLHVPTQEKLTFDEVLDRFGERLPVPSRFEKRRPPDWLKELMNSIPFRFIETQRLLSFSSTRHPRGFREAQMVPAVVNYSEELSDMIQSTLAKYGSLSQSLDRTFPSRLVKISKTHELTVDELQSRLNELEKKRSRLMEIGLLDKEKEIDFRDLQQIDDSNINVLYVYIEDVEKKLSVLNELASKIDLLVDIINRRYLYKKLSINKEEGFIIETNDNNILLPSSLSSGEQHELVLFYELLFKVSPNTLILIDEPELSLHVAWQQQFLQDLKEVTDLTGLDVLIATHSPQIIHDRWDLTVELKGNSE